MERCVCERGVRQRGVNVIKCDHPHKKDCIHASDGNRVLISFESLDIATSNSASGGFISVSVLKLRQLKWITFRATHSRKQATSVFLHDSVY